MRVDSLPLPRGLAVSWLLLLSSTPLWGQKVWHEAARPDSFLTYGISTVTDRNGDTVAVEINRSFAPIGDTITTRRQALTGWAGMSAYVKIRGYRKAAIVYLWPSNPTDSLTPDNIASTWRMLFAADESGCWHIVNDTTPISNCVARDGPGVPEMGDSSDAQSH